MSGMSFVTISSMSLLLSISSAALLSLSAAASPAAPSSAAPKAALPWIENDYARAMAEAKRRGVPVFVEAWAPW